MWHQTNVFVSNTSTLYIEVDPDRRRGARWRCTVAQTIENQGGHSGPQDTRCITRCSRDVREDKFQRRSCSILKNSKCYFFHKKDPSAQQTKVTEPAVFETRENQPYFVSQTEQVAAQKRKNDMLVSIALEWEKNAKRQPWFRR